MSLEQLADGITDPQIRGRVLEKRALHGGVDFDTQLELFAQARELHEQSGNPDEVARIVINTRPRPCYVFERAAAASSTPTRVARGAA